MPKRLYKLRSTEKRLEDLKAEIARLEAASEKRNNKIGRLREEAQRLQNALTPILEKPSA